MTNDTFNTSDLNVRLEEQKQKNDFYLEGMLMLRDVFDLPGLLQNPETSVMFPTLEDEYLFTAFKNNEEIDKSHILRTDIDSLDDFLFSSLFMIGILQVESTLLLEGSSDSLEYRDWLMSKVDDPMWFLQVGMLGAHFLLTGVVASMDLLERLAPNTDDKEINQMTCNLIIEYYHDTVSRYKFHKQKTNTPNREES